MTHGTGCNLSNAIAFVFIPMRTARKRSKPKTCLSQETHVIAQWKIMSSRSGWVNYTWYETTNIVRTTRFHCTNRSLIRRQELLDEISSLSLRCLKKRNSVSQMFDWIFFRVFWLMMIDENIILSQLLLFILYAHPYCTVGWGDYD